MKNILQFKNKEGSLVTFFFVVDVSLESNSCKLLLQISLCTAMASSEKCVAVKFSESADINDLGSQNLQFEFGLFNNSWFISFVRYYL